eukprot:6175562-Pleurochrysis_carterae.AAC.3
MDAPPRRLRGCAACDGAKFVSATQCCRTYCDAVVPGLVSPDATKRPRHRPDATARRKDACKDSVRE